MKTIYVSTATLDDSETEKTILNIFDSATHPERVYIGLSCSTKNKSFYKNLLKVASGKNVKIAYIKIKNNSLENWGTGQARARALTMYDGQDYFLQCDSHTHFEQGWDETLIDLFEEAKQAVDHDKVVLTAYLGKYHYAPERKALDSRAHYPYYISGFFGGGYVKWTDKSPEDLNQNDKFYPCVKFNGNFAFGDKEFAKNPGVYDKAFFYDEEIIQGINLINSGFYMVFPNIKLPLTHLYTDYINEFGGERLYFTQYISDEDSKYLQNIASANYNKLINNIEYVKKYEEYAKINLRVGLYKDSYYIPEKYS
jgi:hypothetical protein